jgi:hypothetical protein
MWCLGRGAIDFQRTVVTLDDAEDHREAEPVRDRLS